ncbi:hypothetical protein SLEP1_g6763 [Rubroshorea leprosula]|uniref:CCHC-type domain-containing protein n=1 Tax=Rubroshorea leprosula TaxID=152421 RepID=A0AAV5HWK3_9ROSI|nr:hypothetical protein SLEP1_g6763 [Rubroshorea leprosula]
MAYEKDGSTMIKLNTSNYSLWKTLIEDKLFRKDLYDPIEHKGIKPPKINDVEWKKIDRKACGVIRKWVDMSVIHHVAQEKESYKLWTKLEELFERKNALKKASLIRKLVNLKYKEGKNVFDHLNNFQQILNELVTMKLAIDDELVKDSILSEESRRKEQGIMSFESKALVTKYRGKSKQRFTRKDNDRQSQERYSKGKSKGRSKSKSRVICYTCGKQGHYQKDYWHNKDKNIKKMADTHGEKEAKENTTAITSDDEVYLLCENDSIDVAHHDSTWVVDTAASYHVTPNKDWFSSYKEGDFGYLKMGNRFEAKIVGVGDVWLETNIRSKLNLKNVRHVPKISLNLMSMGMLDDDDYLNYFSNGTWKLTKGTVVVARGKKRFSLYETQAKQCQRHINVTEVDATELWDKRLRHLSEKGLQILSKKELVPSFIVNLSKTEVDNQQVQEPIVEHFVEEETHQEEQKEWLMAMQEEMGSLQENGTYELVELPKDKKALNKKWVFKVNFEVNNLNPRFKARLVVQGFGQQKGIDYDEIFSPIVKMTSIRAILALVGSLNLEIEQVDVNTAFLHGDLEEGIYMKQPKGFKVQGKKNLVLQIEKKLIWSQTSSKAMKDKKLWLSQEKYTEKVLDRFNMSKAKPVSTPLACHFKISTEQCPTRKEQAKYMKNVLYASAVGSLMYAMVCTRPDIAHAVGVVSKFLSNLGKQHWVVVKWIFRYLRGTSHMCLCYGEHEPLLNGYSDADLGGHLESRKSTLGYLMLYARGAIS